MLHRLRQYRVKACDSYCCTTRSKLLQGITLPETASLSSYPASVATTRRIATTIRGPSQQVHRRHQSIVYATPSFCLKALMLLSRISSRGIVNGTPSAGSPSRTSIIN